MIKADLHNHTRHSHAADSVAAMAEAAQAKGLEFFGLSEHSPRPDGYLYPADYQEKLLATYGQYIDEVKSLRAAKQNNFRVLLGLEVDFMPDEEAFARRAVSGHDFDYVIGGLHFQGNWGFDYAQADWDKLDETRRRGCYVRYYRDLAALCRSGVAQIIAHPDLIKLFSADSFKRWLDTKEAEEVLAETFGLMKELDLIMEVSSAGLRKPCREIYPGPRIMELAAGLGLKICLSSDAHSTAQIAYAFDELESYCKSFGFGGSWIVEGGRQVALPFDKNHC
ncbi:MAG: histidinol-phosphatase [Deltaproteobacteria bacterium]|jgi:histidinol-phosphatase (PHP family)|nr:histidinol-phosphatase [Deltaproteobacteria bacterium]